MFSGVGGRDGSVTGMLATTYLPTHPTLHPTTHQTERIDRCANEQQLERLLAASFPYLIIPELRSVPERIIARLRRVPPRFLDRLVAKPHILEELPMRVKQQVRVVIWVLYACIPTGTVGRSESSIINRHRILAPPNQAWEAHPALFRKALAALVEQYVGNRTVVVNPAVDWVLAGGLGAAVRGTSTQKRYVGGVLCFHVGFVVGGSD